MSEANTSDRYFLCHGCSHAILVASNSQETIVCDRCGHKNHRLRPKSISLTLAYALTALVFYVPANMFPFMTIELYGNRNSSTIWSGIRALADGGSWLIALVVFLASMLIPFVKLVVLFYLALTARSSRYPRFKTRLYYVVETIGRWSMLDIYLLAVLVAIMKLGPWTTVEPELGSVLFVGVVIFTMLASANFDPKLLWKSENEK